MSRGRALGWVALLLLLVQGCERSKPAPDDDGAERRAKPRRSTKDHDKADARDDAKVLRELTTWVRDAQAAAFVRGDEKAYYAIYGDDAQVVTARSEHPHPYDYVVPVKRSREFLEIRGKVKPLRDYAQRYDEESQKLDGDEATLRWDVHTTWKQDDGKHAGVFGERYKLVREDEKWRVSEKRTWTVSVTRPALDNEKAAYPDGVTYVCSDASWTEVDAGVDRARLVGGAPLFWALTQAGRYPEAHELAKLVTADPRATGEAWYLLGVAAQRLHFGDETKLAFAKARALDPRIYPPAPWGPEPPKAKSADPDIVDLMRRASTL